MVEKLSLPKALMLLRAFRANEAACFTEIERERHRREGTDADIRRLRAALVAWVEGGDLEALRAIVPIDRWGLVDSAAKD